MSGTFCEDPHPTLKGVMCGRPSNHDDDHRSFGHGRTPGYVWPKAQVGAVASAPGDVAAVTVKYPAPDAICVVCGARGDNHPARHPFRIAANVAQPAKPPRLSLKDAAALFPPIGPDGTVKSNLVATGPARPPFVGGSWFPPVGPPSGTASHASFLGVNHPEPPPQTSSGDVWNTVIDDMRGRREFGVTKYKTPLQPFNGRDPMADLYQELLDAVVYQRQAMMERDVARKFLADIQALARQYVCRLADEARCAQFGAEVMRLLGMLNAGGPR